MLSFWQKDLQQVKKTQIFEEKKKLNISARPTDSALQVL